MINMQTFFDYRKDIILWHKRIKDFFLLLLKEPRVNSVHSMGGGGGGGGAAAEREETEREGQ